MNTTQPSEDAGTPLDEQARLAHELVSAMLSDANAGALPAVLREGLRGPAFRKAMAELEKLDPGLQRDLARALARSGGDPEAVRAIVADLRLGRTPSTRRAAGVSPRPPTVVDARAGSRRGVLVLLVAFAAAVGWLALQASQ